jgi:hypothetical protein
MVFAGLSIYALTVAWQYDRFVVLDQHRIQRRFPEHLAFHNHKTADAEK